MSLLVLESFDSFGASGTTGSDLENALKAKYGAANIDTGTDASIVDGYVSGLGIQSNYDASDGKNYIKFAFSVATNLITGFFFKTPTDLSTQKYLLVFTNATPADIFWLGLTLDFKLVVRGGEYWYSTRVLKPSTWYYIELKITFNDTTGAVTLKINNETDIAKTNVDTLSTGSTGPVALELNISVGVGSIIDDFYLADDTSDFIGPSKIEAIRPSGDDTVAWDCSTGSDRYALVNDSGPNATTYVEGDTVNESDLYTYSNLATITGNILGVQINTAAQLDAAGTRILVDSINSNGVVSNGAGVALASTNYETIYRILEEDPDVNANWTVTTINALKAGIIVGD